MATFPLLITCGDLGEAQSGLVHDQLEVEIIEVGGPSHSPTGLEHLRVRTLMLFILGSSAGLPN